MSNRGKILRNLLAGGGGGWVAKVTRNRTKARNKTGTNMTTS
jgi:hypothetical protein